MFLAFLPSTGIPWFLVGADVAMVEDQICEQTQQKQPNMKSWKNTLGWMCSNINWNKHNLKIYLWLKKK
jgi:hypothetical protein